jgi:hypothetical protein
VRWWCQPLRARPTCDGDPALGWLLAAVRRRRLILWRLLGLLLLLLLLLNAAERLAACEEVARARALAAPVDQLEERRGIMCCITAWANGAPFRTSFPPMGIALWLDQRACALCCWKVAPMLLMFLSDVSNVCAVTQEKQPTKCNGRGHGGSCCWPTRNQDSSIFNCTIR